MKREDGSITLEATMVVMLLFICVVSSYFLIFDKTRKTITEFDRTPMEIVDPVEFCDTLNSVYQYASAILDGVDFWVDSLGDG